MDNQSPHPENHASRPTPLRHLAQWHAEWQGCETLAPQSARTTQLSLSGDSDQREQAFAFPAYDDEPEGFTPGSVRILSASITEDTMRPIHILILDEEDQGSCRFAPFSDFSAPATDGELLVAEDPEQAGFPCVIQVWNARDCPRDLLARSWFSHRVAEDVVRRARIVDRDLPLPENASALIGAALDKPQDPRHGYIATETERLEPLTRRALDFQKPPAEVIAFPEASVAIPALAAAPHPEERMLDYHVWTHPRSGVVLHISELVGHPGGYTLRVEGDSASLFEGASVMDGAGRRLGRIIDGALGDSAHPLRFAGRSMRVTSADGTPLILARRVE